MENKIYFYGSFPPKNKAAYGGGEEGNLRTVKLLQSLGYEVTIIRKLRSRSSSSDFVKLMTYPWRFLDGIVKFFFIALFGSRNSIVHISGFGGYTVFNEFLIVSISKLMGYFTIFEIRGGGFFINQSKWYIIFRNWILRHSDYIFSQGMENKPLIEQVCQKPFFYYPNYLDTEFLPKELPHKDMQEIRLFFFGRIEQAKNVKLIVEIAAILQKQYNNVTLTIIGNGQADYVADVRTLMRDRLVPGSYELLPGCPHDELRKHLPDKHFYIFPSEQIFEGHSNAVTEAMAYGIVPIASPQGFSRTVVGNDELIVDELSAEQYAKRIARIIEDNRFNELSAFVYNRIQENYTCSIVRNQLSVVYSKI